MDTYKEHENDFPGLLEIAGNFHGDICGGIELGTRMTMRGLTQIGISDPVGEDRKKLIVFVEIDRCATDAIMALTGCRPGKRTMKICDYGKMAATFINLDSGQAVRVAARARNKPGNGQRVDFSLLSDEELFSVNEVEVDLKPEDLPGLPVRSTSCSSCGESVLDGREIERGESVLCRSCSAGIAYYHIKN